MKQHLARFLVGFSVLWLVACVSDAPQRPEVNASEAANYNTQLGMNYLAQGKYDVALEKFDRAREQDPKLPDTYVGYAQLYTRLGQPELADENYRKAIRLAPDRGDLHNNYGVFLCGQRRLEESEEQFLLALEDPKYTTQEFAYTNAGVCARLVPDKDKAENYFRKALMVNPQFGDALWQMAVLAYERNDHLKARAFLSRFHVAEQPTAESLLLGYRVETYLGDVEAAETYATRLAARFPNSPQAKRLGELQRQ
ncbi:MAG: type IV pilus biogenesis/stability protein PilW [Pseudomonadota bacterium]|nr:type IV pilus biogenesis/stability protein PilW [Pseudomonadota bacterium]